jgi:hypothetical protein
LLPRLAWRVVLITTLVALLGLGPYLATTRASGGWLKFKNEHSARVDVAVWYLDESKCGPHGWMSEGWWNLDPGEVATTIQMSSNTYYYYYARASDGVVWSSTTNGAWVPSTIFTECEHDNRSYSPGPGYRWVGMKALKVEDTDRGYIMSLTSPNSCPQPPSPGGGVGVHRSCN